MTATSSSLRRLGLGLLVLTAGCEAILGLEPTHESSAAPSGASGGGGASTQKGDGGNVSAPGAGHGAGSAGAAATSGAGGSPGPDHGGTTAAHAGRSEAAGSGGHVAPAGGNSHGGATGGASGASQSFGDAGDSASGAAGQGGEAGGGGAGGGSVVDPLDGALVGPGHRCLTVGDGAAGGSSYAVTATDCRGENTQRFRRTYAGGFEVDDQSGLVLAVQGDAGVWEGAPLVAAPEDPVALEQHWLFDPAELIEATSGLCVSVPNAAYDNGQQLELDVCRQDGQFWTIDASGVVTYYGWCLDIPSGIAAPTNVVQTFECNNGSNQRFEFSGGHIAFGGLCVAAGDGSAPEPGYPLALATCDVKRPAAAGEQRYLMRGVLTSMGLCLEQQSDGAGGVKLSVEPCNYGPMQFWSYYF